MCVSFLTQSDVEFLQDCETVQKWILTRTHNFTLMQRWIVLSSVFACVGLLAFEWQSAEKCFGLCWRFCIVCLWSSQQCTSCLCCRTYSYRSPALCVVGFWRQSLSNRISEYCTQVHGVFPNQVCNFYNFSGCTGDVKFLEPIGWFYTKPCLFQ